jgi:Protein of unknown function (DUF2568)
MDNLPPFGPPGKDVLDADALLWQSEPMTAVLLGLRFLLELGLLAAVAVVGAAAFPNPVAGGVTAAVLVVATAALWGLLLSPRRPVDLPLVVRVVVEIALFGGAALGLAAAGHVVWGVVLLSAEVIVVAALAGLGYPPGRRPETHADPNPPHG